MATPKIQPVETAAIRLATLLLPQLRDILLMDLMIVPEGFWFRVAQLGCAIL